jgi:hypothetical protein
MGLGSRLNAMGVGEPSATNSRSNAGVSERTENDLSGNDAPSSLPPNHN